MNRKKVVSLLMCLTLSAPLLSGCAVTDNMALVKINGSEDKITYGYGKFNAKMTQALYDMTYQSYMGEDMWSSDPSNTGSTMEENVKSGILTNMKEQYVLVKHAKDYDVKLSKDDEKKIDKAAKAFMKANSKKAIKELGATEEYAKRYLEDKTISEKVRTKIEEKADTNVTDEEANQKKISVAFFNTITKTDKSGKSVAVTKEDMDSMKEQANALASASDFDAKATELGITVGSLNYGKTEMASAKKSGNISDSNSTQIPYDVLKEVDKLSDGQNTGVIEKDQGYFVIKMVSTSDKEATESAKANLVEKKKTDFYQKKVDKYEAKITWSLNDFLWGRVRFIDTFKGTLGK
ncbi:MAG: peptidyl-prolyl cis-trans isomerase [Lachnospiraceae bacterium]|nr:peptidyl-prolyl cis-trans isomerase [Lachnospiraceae bacterium]